MKNRLIRISNSPFCIASTLCACAFLFAFATIAVAQWDRPSETSDLESSKYRQALTAYEESDKSSQESLQAALKIAEEAQGDPGAPRQARALVDLIKAEIQRLKDAELERQEQLKREEEEREKERQEEERRKREEEERRQYERTLTFRGVEVKFRKISSGDYKMGSPAKEPGRFPEEGQRDVTIAKDFWLAETETTQRLWAAIMSNNPSSQTGEDLPVDNVSWEDAQSFIEKLNAEFAEQLRNEFGDDSFTLRLPSEEEWEYACRAGTPTAFWWGDDPEQVDGKENLVPKIKEEEYMTSFFPFEDGYEFVAPVGSFKSNPWGLKDMAGNVWEFCQDVIDAYPGGSSTEVSDRVVFRGGAYGNNPDCQRAFARAFNRTTYRADRAGDVGFRLVMTTPDDDSALAAGVQRVVNLGGAITTFRWIPSGNYMRGGKEPVEITRGFWMAETETTEALWKAIMGENTDPMSKGGSYPKGGISWEDCQQFVFKLNQVVKQSNRNMEFGLPTETQWEYAYRAGTTTLFWWGDNISEGYGRLNARNITNPENERGSEFMARLKASKVGEGIANPLGLYDMHGNVAEWCLNEGHASPVGDMGHAVRGGFYWCEPALARSATRRWANGARKGLGFRLAIGGAPTFAPKLPSEPPIVPPIEPSIEPSTLSGDTDKGFGGNGNNNGDNNDNSNNGNNDSNNDNNDDDNNSGSNGNNDNILSKICGKLRSTLSLDNESLAGLLVKLGVFTLACCCLLKLFSMFKTRWNKLKRRKESNESEANKSVDVEREKLSEFANRFATSQVAEPPTSQAFSLAPESPQRSPASEVAPSARGIEREVAESQPSSQSSVVERELEEDSRTSSSLMTTPTESSAGEGKRVAASGASTARRRRAEPGELAKLSICGVELRMRWIPKGEFIMGSVDTEAGRRADESERLTRLKHGFWMAETPTTQALWRAVMGTNPSGFTGDDLPVETVTWGACQEFVRSLNESKFKVPRFLFALPTEAQWERACRAGGRSAYSFGDEFDPQLANCRFTSADLQARNRTTPVRSYPPNAFGLYDMHGNVWEWCADAYAPYDPQAQVDPVGVPDSDGDVTRSCRGGSWFHGYERSRSASRGEWAPTYRSSYLGFRIILYKEGLE